MSLQEKFNGANTTLDGRLTLDQAKAANMTQVVSNFEKMDTEKNGYLLFDQVKSFKSGKRASISKSLTRKGGPDFRLLPVCV